MGPTMRASDEMLWPMPRMPPCFAGSLQRDNSELSDGVINAKPLTTTANADQQQRQRVVRRGRGEQQKAADLDHCAR